MFKYDSVQAQGLIWAKQISVQISSGVASGSSITTDETGSIYTIGTFSSTCDLDPGPGTSLSGAASGMYLLKLALNGDFLWAKTSQGLWEGLYNWIIMDICV